MQSSQFGLYENYFFDKFNYAQIEKVMMLHREGTKTIWAKI